MNQGQSFVHRGLQIQSYLEFKKFCRALSHPEQSQSEVLHETLLSSEVSPLWRGQRLHFSSIRDFQNKTPISRYSTYEERLKKIKSSGDPFYCRWEPTSGSTHHRKWIPYGKTFLEQWSRASSPWIFDLYRKFPKIKNGPHYWSLSHLPSDLRIQKRTQDDSELFPWWQQLFLKSIFPLPAALSRVESLEAFWFATQVYLVSARDLSLISVWSPSFLSELLLDIEKNWLAIRHTLKSKDWGVHRQDLKDFSVPSSDLRQFDIDPTCPKSLWPNLALVSAWDSSTSSYFAEELKSRIQGVAFQGKGLWSTEFVVSIPFENKYPLALRSHFFEFRDLQSSKIFLVQDLKEGMEVVPIVSAAQGFLRYDTQDCLRVKSFLSKTPSLEFIGREQNIDLVGEKLDSQMWSTLLSQLSQEGLGIFFGIQAHIRPRAHYKIIASSKCPVSDLTYRIENELKKFHHYRLARELGQLDQVELILCQNRDEIYRQNFPKGVKSGGLKPEVIHVVEHDLT